MALYNYIGEASCGVMRAATACHLAILELCVRAAGPVDGRIFDVFRQNTRVTVRARWQYQAEPGGADPGVGAGAKDGDANTKISEAVAMGFGNPFNHAVKAEPSQLISHAASREVPDGLAPEGGQIVAQIAVGKPGGQQIENQQRIPDSLHHRIGEPESRSTLVIQDAGKIELLERLFGDHAIMRDALCFQQTTVSLEADFAKSR